MIFIFSGRRCVTAQTTKSPSPPRNTPTTIFLCNQKKEKAGYNSPANNNYLHNLLSVGIVNVITLSGFFHAVFSPGEIIICPTL